MSKIPSEHVYDLIKHIVVDMPQYAASWQSIATAPKDGEILVWDGTSIRIAAHAYDDRWQPDGLPSFVPTHWMPLPPPPQKDGT